MDWLQQGSRALFGTVVEEEIYILLDTSASMQHSIHFVKERLLVLMQEQLRHKARFNLVAFNSKVTTWRDRLTDVNEQSLQSAWKWVQELTCWGSTNTYAAIQTALSDPHTQAIYLLTDGRPDQTAKTILTQVQMQKQVPIHTISFNCHDNDANHFLHDLAHATGARYHRYSQQGSQSAGQPHAWQSEDVKLLQDELERGLEYLDQMAELRDRWASMAWKTEIDSLKNSSASKSHAFLDAVPSPDTQDLFHPPSISRPSSASPQSPTPPVRPTSAVTFRPSRPQGSPKRPQSAKGHRGRKLVAGESEAGWMSRRGRGHSHTRTSLLRTLNSSGRFTPSEWLLPETAQLFDQQSHRQRHLAEKANQVTKHKKRRHKLAKSHTSSSKQWLKRNGLVARRLTILDALSPTLVPHRSTYVPVLDKRVMARVFDEILPFAHVSSRQKNKMTLVNPSAINLSDYEDKLEKVIARYTRRLDTIVWNALPQSVKEEFETEEPASFPENRSKFLQALEEEEWPVTYSDIVALEKEIAKGEVFLRQSRDLRRATTTTEGKTDAASDVSAPPSVKESEIEEESRTLEFLEKDEEEKELRRKQRAQIREENRHKKDILVVDTGRPVYFWHWKVHKNTCDQGYMFVKTNFRINSIDQVLQVRDSEIVTAPTTPRVGSERHTPQPPDIPPTPRSSQDGPLETPRSPENPTPRSQSIRTPRPPDASSTPRSATSHATPRKLVAKERGKTTAAQAANTSRDMRESGNHTGKYPKGSRDTSSRQNSARKEKSATSSKSRVTVSMLRGTKVIARSHADGLYYPGKVMKCPSVRHAIVEFTGGEQDVLTRFILPVGGAVACPPLFVGDYALVQVMNLEMASECYVPSIVQFSPCRSQSSTKFYTVMLYNGQKVTTRRSHLVKISKERFELTARYIADIQGEDRLKTRDKVYIYPKRRTEKRRTRDHRQRSLSASSRDSRSPSTSRSRSPTPPSRPRSPTPAHGISGSRRRSEVCRSASPYREITEEKRQRSSKMERDTRSRSHSDSPSRHDRLLQSVRQKELNKRSRSRSRSSESRSITPVTDRQKELSRLKKQLKRRQSRQAKEHKKLKRRVKELTEEQTELRKKVEEEEKPDEPEEEEPPVVTPRMLQLRRNLPPLQPAEEVLARFSDDGWYYRGTVRQNVGDLSYIVEDATGHIEKIWREDIISDYDDNAPPVKVDDRVVAQHPHHSSSYAPGSVLSFDDVLQVVTVRFYDGQEGAVPRTEVYRLARDKYNHDVLHIQQRQQSMMGLSVVTRDDDSGGYFPGQIVEVKEGGQSYVVRWSDGSCSEQLPVHIFSAVTHRPWLMVGDRVLAMADPQQVVFLPGQIIGAQDGNMVVRFCDGQVRDDVCPLFSYWLPSGYFEEASYFWKIHQPNFGKRQINYA
ncbi:hypothetical protein ACOMHN_017764 [Nucella lapillus]